VCRIGILLIVILLMIIALPDINADVETAGKTNIGMVTDALRNGTTEEERKVRTDPEIIIHLDNRCKLVHAMMLRTTSNKFC